MRLRGKDENCINHPQSSHATINQRGGEYNNHQRSIFWWIHPSTTTNTNNDMKIEGALFSSATTCRVQQHLDLEFESTTHTSVGGLYRACNNQLLIMKQSTADSRAGDAKGYAKLDMWVLQKSMGKRQPDNTIAVNGTINTLLPIFSEQVL